MVVRAGVGGLATVVQLNSMKLVARAGRERSVDAMRGAYRRSSLSASVGCRVYLQVMPGNTLPSTESGSVQSKFGKALAENIRIDVYKSPHGKGYQIYYEENGVAHSVGYGAEAGDRTFTIEFPKPALSATSTPAVQ